MAMKTDVMRKAIVAANKRRQRLIRAGFGGYSNVNLIQNIIDTANRINPFTTGKKRTTLNPKATGAELRRQFLAAKQILNMEKSSLRQAKKDRKILEQEVSRRQALGSEYGIDFDNLSERRIRALYNLLSDSNVRRLIDIYSSDEVVTQITEAYNKGDTVSNIRKRILEVLNNLGDLDAATVEELERVGTTGLEDIEE